MKRKKEINKEQWRIIFDKIAQGNNVKRAAEWGNITNAIVTRFPGGASILSHHGGSLFKSLEDIYPGLLNVLRK